MYTDKYRASIWTGSDTSGMSLFTSPYWLYKCFIIPILRIYIIYQILIILEKLKHC